MVAKTPDSLKDLYLADETAWLDTMAELIRTGRLAELDYSHLAEYLEDMAKRDRREVESRLKVLLAHVLKWVYQKKKRSTSWENTVCNLQEQLESLLEGGVLVNHAELLLPTVYQKARKQAARETKLPEKTFPVECPWTLEQLLSAEVLNHGG